MIVVLRECATLQMFNLRPSLFARRFLEASLSTHPVCRHHLRTSMWIENLVRREPDGTGLDFVFFPLSVIFVVFSAFALRGRYPVPEVYHPSIFIRAEALSTLNRATAV